jgi:hypothetical protein
VLANFVYIATLVYSLTKLGNIVDDRLNPLLDRTEPVLDTQATGAAPANDLPAWLLDAVPAPAGTWKRTVSLWGGALAALAVVFAGSMWLFAEHSSGTSTAVVAPGAPAPAVQAQQEILPERKPSALPPLVLLTPAPAVPPVPAADKPAVPAPVAAKPLSVQAAVPQPVAVAPKTVAKAAAKPSPARSVVKAVLPKPVLVAKPAVAAPKRAPVLAKAKPKVVAGVMLPPARARRAIANAEPPPANTPSKCRTGELARECAARNGSY